jgi:hypothetical protein
MSIYLPGGLRGLKLTPCELRLAQAARSKFRGRDVLYHGTRSIAEILQTRELRLSNSGGVYFTRSPEFAAYYALSVRDHVGCPGLMIFDRLALKQSYRLRPNDEGWPPDCEAFTNDEAEEVIWGRPVGPISRYLVGVVLGSDTRGICIPCLESNARNRMQPKR